MKLFDRRWRVTVGTLASGEIDLRFKVTRTLHARPGTCELELFNLECWALTAESLFHTEEWIWLYKEFGYNGDYEFIYFE